MKNKVYKKFVPKIYYKLKRKRVIKITAPRLVASTKDEQLRIEFFKDLVPEKKVETKRKLFYNTNFH